MLVLKQAIILKESRKKEVDCIEKLMFGVAGPGVGDTAVLRVGGGRVFFSLSLPGLHPRVPPTHFAFPASPHAPAASSDLVAVPAQCPASLCLGIFHFLCPLLQTSSSRESSSESHPPGCALPARGFCCVLLHSANVSVD